MSKKITNFAVANGKQAAAPRRGAGVVDRGGLENRCTLTGTQGSNPCLSASDEKQFYPVHQGWTAFLFIWLIILELAASKARQTPVHYGVDWQCMAYIQSEMCMICDRQKHLFLTDY